MKQMCIRDRLYLGYNICCRRHNQYERAFYVAAPPDVYKRQDAERNIWIATNYEGIVRINLQDKTYKRYAVGQKRDVQNMSLIHI